MSQSKDIRIPFNKFKLTIFLLGSLAFVAAGFYFLIEQPEIMRNPGRYGRLGKFLGPTNLGVISIVFFGAAMIVILSNLITKKEAIIVAETELILNSFGFKYKKIPFHLINHVSIQNYGSNSMIKVKYLKPKKNAPKSFSKKTTHINKNSIRFNLNELFDILEERVNIASKDHEEIRN